MPEAPFTLGLLIIGASLLLGVVGLYHERRRHFRKRNY